MKVSELSWDRWLATGGGAAVCLWHCSGTGPAGRKPRLYEGSSQQDDRLSIPARWNNAGVSRRDAFLFIWDPFKHNKIIGGSGLSSPARCLQWCSGGKLAVGQEDGKIIIFKIQADFHDSE